MRIGLLFPVGGPTIEEYYQFARRLEVPAELFVARTGGLDRHDEAGMLETGKMERLRTGIEALRGHVPHVLAFPCTCASFGYPAGADAQAAELAHAAGVPATSATVALGAACRAVGVRVVALAATYPERVTALFVQYLNSVGIEVAGVRNLGLMSGEAVSAMSAETTGTFIAESDVERAEAVVVPDTALFTLSHIVELEKTLGKFVITANQATMWHALRLARSASCVPDFGRVMAYDLDGSLA